ncbi:membrane fusion protein, cobalt-zinc-cadmium efflux system [Bryocella elongata]|uniref:Membrane fusion protein, cobalt-zinc-cadmium efflux system n=1 Tax=Bryocella elongata TaxID=863522 RepID=A0A1H5UTL7_9BACT|nr:efflux RND transporter periplasmic adaptor subunit [Bryocella elongata]SEF78425.1 membrane fusion protein, cobalt-zinc-cadmium efflux system [Bryocella elongata]
MTFHNSSLKVLAAATLCFGLLACEKQKFNPADGTPKPTAPTETGDMSLVKVDKPGLFPIVAAEQINAPAQLNVTGTINPDISREVPVISLASGRVIDIKTRLGNEVKKGQLLLQVQSNDITNAFDSYLKAVNDEQLANKAYLRAKDLYQNGAVPLSALEQAEDSEKDANTDLNAAEEQLRNLGVNKNHPSSIVPVYAPISGVIISQNVTNAAAVGVTYSGSSTAFTIADLSTIWVLCDVYENDLPKIAVGQSADIHVTGYPGRALQGMISEIDPILDPSVRTAKVRLEVRNPGFLKLGMFVNATLASKQTEVHAVVPASAILHLHDRDWVYVPAGGKQFRRIEVHSGNMLPGNRQEVLSGISAGQPVVSNVLQLAATLEAQ